MEILWIIQIKKIIDIIINIIYITNYISFFIDNIIIII